MRHKYKEGEPLLRVVLFNGNVGEVVKHYPNKKVGQVAPEPGFLIRDQRVVPSSLYKAECNPRFVRKEGE